MAGILSKSMTQILWQTILKMPINFVPLLIGLVMLGSSSLMYLPLKGQGQVFLQGQQVNGFPLSFSFFPSLKCDLERLCKEHRSDILGKTNSIHRIMPSQSHVTPVTSKDTLLRTVHTEQVKSRPETSVIQQQHSLPQQSPKSSRVEYSFHIQNTNITIVNGRLIKCLDFWKSELKASSFVLNIISDGYKIPFVQQPSSALLKNNRSALEHEDFVSNEIHALLQKQCIEEVNKPPFCVNPLTVSVNNSGKKRLILDLRHVNKFIQQQKIKFEGHVHAVSYAKKGNVMFKFDLASGYHHISINRDFVKFLGFSWNIDGKVRYFVFLVLPFGISSACHCFTKLLRPLVKHWRAKGFCIVVYLDDGWGTDSVENCKFVSDSVHNDLKLAGFVVNLEKSVWVPCSVLEWLGYTWNMQLGTVTMPTRKVIAFKDMIKVALQKKEQISARFIAKITGKLMSMSFVFGNICQIMSRHAYSLIEGRTSWDADIKLSNLACEELEFWLKHVEHLPCRSFNIQQRYPERVMFTDASNFAGAGVLLHSQNQVSHLMFDEFVKSQSSTFRELKALHNALLSFSPFLLGKFVKVYTDNQNVVRIVSKGSTVRSLQLLARKIFDFCLIRDIVLELAWLPRELNQISDFYSKQFDYDDWGVSDSIFSLFDKKWGPFSCDRFADQFNSKLENFNSKYWCPNTSGVDAFAFDWHADYNWLVPPIHLVPRVLMHMFLFRAKGALVVPKWESSFFWPLLVESRTGIFRKFVLEAVEYSKPSGFFKSGSDVNSIFAANPFPSNVIVLKLDGALM